MTRKYFVLIAANLRDHRRAAATSEARDLVEQIALDQCDIFAVINPSFDRDRFLAAVLKD